MALPSMASAAIVGVSGGASTGTEGGAFASLITAPIDVLEDGTANNGQQGFDEQQNIVTSTAYSYFDNSLVTQTLAAGSRISSHMIFLNTAGNGVTKHGGVVWTFLGNIIGVMADRNGTMEIASSGELGAAGTTYEMGNGTSLSARGMENTNGTQTNADSFSFVGSVLTLEMYVSEPGDWIRVITAAPPAVPIPAGLPLVLTGLGVFGLMRRKKKTA